MPVGFSAEIEQQVLACVARGDKRTAAELLMRAYGDRVHSLCRRLVRDTACAEDVSQQVFVQAYRDLDRFAGQGSLLSWLQGIAFNRAFDAIRQQQRSKARVVVDGEMVDTAMDEGADARELLERSNRWRALDDCLQRLKEDSRAIVVQRFWSGLSYEELSEQLGEQPATLQARVARALPLLKRCMERKGVAL